MTDPIADMLTRIRNGYLARQRTVEIPYSKLKWSIINILKEVGYIKDTKSKDTPLKTITATLAYHGKLPVVEGIQRVSKPGRRIYVKKGKIPMTLGGQGITVISTNKGMMTDHQARKEKLGGEVICKVW